MVYWIGKREEGETDAFIADLRKRVKGEPQITTDGFKAYPTAIANTFGNNVHFAQQVKRFTHKGTLPKKVRLAWPVDRRCLSVKTFIRIGNPDVELISTSHVERTNLSVRLFNRRYTRLTLGFSKVLDNLKHSTALLIGYFNFCRIHGAHGKTPAQAAGITDHAWTIEELLICELR